MRTSILILLLASGLAACDSVETDPEALVLEAFFSPHAPLPLLTVSRAVPLSDPALSADVSGAAVSVGLNGQTVRYRETNRPGRYEPLESVVLQPGDAFSVLVVHDGDTARASGLIPPPIRLDSIRVSAASAPIAAVLLDSLSLRLDSLAFQVPSEVGYIYPVDVTLWWQSTAQQVEDHWVETSIRPRQAFSSRLIDFFLRPSSVLEEPVGTQVSWRGLYAVPVEREQDPFPPHAVDVAVIRSSLAYARFALSRGDPDRREPVSNVTGGLGIVAGVSVDSIRVEVQ